MQNKIKNILKLFVFILIIKTTFSVSFGTSLLGEDLGFNLYKTIDKGIKNLGKNQFSYELKGQEPQGKIKDKVNNVLKIKGYGKCKLEKDLSESEFEEIVGGSIGLLSSKLSKNCLSSISVLNGITKEIISLKIVLSNRAEQKAKKIFEISRVGLYTDGNLDNSPFDLVKDIQDIDYIIFTTKIPYLGTKSINDEEASRWANDVNSEIDRIRKFGDRGGTNGTNIQHSPIIKPASNVPAIPFYMISQDNTNNLCGENNSGLNEGETNSLLVNQNNGNGALNTGNNSNKGNEENNGGNSNNNSGNGTGVGVQDVGNVNSDYFKLTDDELWDCTKFFCIKIDFITYQHSLFGGSVTRSIEGIIQRSNEHLKKIVSTSLVQGKMTTDNFELGLKDLDLTTAFSMGMVVTKKTPPILNLEQFQKDKEQIKKNNKFSSNNLFCRRLDTLGLDCKRENDLGLFLGDNIDQKIINNNAQLDILKINKIYQELNLKQKEKKLMNSFITSAVSNDAQKNETNNLYKQFTELERFIGNINDYSLEIEKTITQMLEIPISGS